MNTSIDQCMTRESFTALCEQCTGLIAHHLYQARERPPYRALPLSTKEAILSLTLPEDGAAPEQIVEVFRELILPYPTFGTGHPKAFGFVAGGADHMAILGSLLAAALNPNCVGGDQSSTYLELSVIRWLQELVGFPTQESGGLLVSGGTTATVLCLTAALEKAFSSLGLHRRADGWQQPHPLFVLYASDETHHCIKSVAELLGIGYRGVHIIPTTPDFRIDMQALRLAILQDRQAGLYPFCAVGNAGTTNSGAVDPLLELAHLCEEEHLWYHVDGSYGAFARSDPQTAPFLSGMERADSLTLDPHKWLSIPYECGCALVRNKQHLAAAFADEPPDYLRELAPHLTNYTFQLSRSFSALKLWMALMARGQNGVAQLVSHHNSLARVLADMLDSAHDMQRCAPVTLSTVCFRYAPTDLRHDETALDTLNRRVVEQVQREGEVFLSGTTLQGRFVLRACVLHPETSLADVSALVNAIRQAGNSLTTLSVAKAAVPAQR